MARLTFNRTSDDHSLDVRREGSFKVIGFLQWHAGKPPHFVSWNGDGSSLDLDEMQQIIDKYNNGRR